MCKYQVDKKNIKFICPSKQMEKVWKWNVKRCNMVKVTKMWLKTTGGTDYFYWSLYLFFYRY